MTAYDGQKLLNALDDAGLSDWQALPDGLRTRYITNEYSAGLDLVQRISSLAEAADHHPDITLTYTHVDVRLISHDVGSVTDRDLRLARQISDLSDELTTEAAPRVPQLLALGLDTANADAIAPFWAALLTGDASNVDGCDIADPTGQVPLLWFQETDPHDTPRQRLHVDICVPAAEAETRIRAVVEAGGTVVDASYQPSFTVLEDADGNRACVCTPKAR